MSKESVRSKQGLRSATELKLLEAALIEFSAKGFDGANINRISINAGYAKGTIYNYYSSKRILMLALIDQVAAEHTHFVMERVNEASNPENRLRQLFHAGHQFVELFPDRARVLSSSIFGHDPEFRTKTSEAYEAIFETVMSELSKGRPESGKREIRKRRVAQVLVMSLYLSSCSLQRETGKKWPEADEVAQFALRGLGLDNRQMLPSSPKQERKPTENWRQW